MSGTVTTLGRETVFNGTIEFTDELAIAGTFCGTVRATGNLRVLKGAKCKVDKIEVHSAVINGEVSGLGEVPLLQNGDATPSAHQKQKPASAKQGPSATGEQKAQTFEEGGGALAQIVATDLVELLSDADVEAFITTGKVRIEDGAQFFGSVTMKSAPDGDTFDKASKEFQGAFVPLQKSVG